MATVKTFEDLVCWKKASDLKKTISVLVKDFPAEEKYRLTDQLIRCTRSVTANIAEGFGRYHYQEFIQFCRQARGSLVETIDHLITASDEGYITKEKLELLKLDIKECLALLNGFIKYLKSAKQNMVEEQESTYGSPDNQQLAINR